MRTLQTPILLALQESAPADPHVSSTSGQIGDTLYQPGWGFTPGGTAELHFRRPDETLSPTTTEIVEADGTYDHYWTVSPDAQTGTYQYWAVDLSSGLTSPEVDYVIWEQEQINLKKNSLKKAGSFGRADRLTC